MDVKATIRTLVGQPIIVGEKTFSDWKDDMLCNVDDDCAAVLLSVNGWEAVVKAPAKAPEPKAEPKHDSKPEEKKRVRGRKEVAE